MRRLLILFLFAWPLFGQAITIPVQNPSFEQPTPGTSDSCGPWTTAAPTGWTAAKLEPGGGYGVLQPANPNPCNISLPPDGTKVGYLFHASISQDLGQSPTVDGLYTIKFSVANRFYWYTAAYSAELTVTDSGGLHHLCKISGKAAGDFMQIPLVCPSQRYYGDLRITFTADGEFQLLLDNVSSLTFTPTN